MHKPTTSKTSEIEQAEIKSAAAGKIWYLEWLRLLACLAVVLIHCFMDILDSTPISTVGLNRALIWTDLLAVFGRWAVPVFLMITGALLLDPKKNIGWEKIRKYVIRIASVLLSFGVLFALMELVFQERTFSPTMLLSAVMNVLQEKSWAHLWYLYDLLGVYLLLPLLRSFVASSDRYDIARMCGILFIFSLCIPTFNDATGFKVDRVIWLGSSVFYVMLGWLLRNHKFTIGKVAIFGFIGIAVQLLIASFGIVCENRYYAWVWTPSSPFVAVYSAAIFLFAKEYLDKPIRKSGIVNRLIQYSFAIYVIHPVFTNTLYKVLDWAAAPLPPVIFEIATYLLIFIPSFFCAGLLRRMPVIKEML